MAEQSNAYAARMTARTAMRKCREKRIIYNLSVRSAQVKDVAFSPFRESVESIGLGFFEDGDAVCEDSVAAVDGVGDGEGLAVG